MTGDKSLPDDVLAERLISVGALTSGGPVDVAFYAMKLRDDPSTIRRGLSVLAERGLLTQSAGWICEACEAENYADSGICHECDSSRSATSAAITLFFRPPKAPGRDIVALFLVHGMATVGTWQQNLSWTVQLAYGYSIPVFIFKFGWDMLSPLARRSQQRRTHQLGDAVRRAQHDLRVHGFQARCDVVSHSFGTLLVASLLKDQAFEDIALGRIVLTGSIVARDYDWDRLLSEGRVEAVLNHRAGRDTWVRLAPWFFPNTGSSGVHGFRVSQGVEDFLSVGFRHSDYFSNANFSQIFQTRWSPFLTRAPAPAERPLAARSVHSEVAHRYFAGRVLLLVLGTLAICCLLFLFALLGQGIGSLLNLTW